MSADNIGAKLQSEQADADKRVAQAKAEVRRAAPWQSNRKCGARTQEMRREGSRSRSAGAAGDGGGVSLRQSRCNGLLPDEKCAGDTSMRESIAGSDKPRTEGNVIRDPKLVNRDRRVTIKQFDDLTIRT